MMAEKIGSLEFDIIGVDNLSEIADASKAKIQGLVDSTVKGGSAMDTAFNKISAEFEKAFGNIELVIGTNKKELQQLQSEYDGLSKKAANAFRAGNDEEYHRLKQTQGALEEQIATRKRLIKEAYQAGDELSKLEDNVAAKVKLNTDEQLKHKKSIVETKKEIESLGIKNIDINLDGVVDIGKITNDAKLKIQYLFNEFRKGSITGAEAAEKIKTAFESAFKSVDTVMETNIAEIKKLEAEYTKLSSESGKAFQSGNDDDYRRIKARQEVLKSEIATRNKLVSEASKSNLELGKLEDKVAAKVKVTSDATGQYRTQIRAAKEEMARMEAQGLRNSAAYRDLQEKAGKLTDQWKDATIQATIMAHDQRGFQGIITGLGGISGAMSAAAGAYGLFAGENENLQKIMTKVQSLMAITIGLQQISQTINKDSAFMLVTVNGLKKWWNEITGKSVVVQTAEAVATKAATAAKKGQTGEIVKGTAATAGNTAATTTGIVATKGLAGGFKAVGLAIKSIPGIGWLLAVVAGLVAVFTLLNKKQKEARAEQEKFTNSVAEIAIEPIAKINELSSSYSRLGTSMKEKEKFVKDNQKAFNDLGVSVKSVADAENLLIKNKDAFIRAQIAKAKATVVKDESKDLIMLQIKAESELEDLKTKYKDYQRSPQTDEYALEPWEQELKLAELKVSMMETGLKARFGLAQEYSEKAEDILDEAGIKDASETKTSDTYKTILEKIKEQYDIYSKAIKSTDETTREAAKEKYKTLIDYAETYLLYLEKERAKLLEIEKGGKKLTKPQKSNLDNINKEISELTQKGEANKLIDEYNKIFDKRLQLQEEYEKDVEIIESERSKLSTEKELKQLETALTNRRKKYENDIDALYSSLEGKYKSYEQRRNDIHKQYLNERKLMEERNAIDVERGNTPTYSSEQFEANLQAESEAVKKINKEETDSVLEKSELIKKIFSDFGKQTEKSVKQTTSQLRQLIAYMEGVTKVIPDGITKEQINAIDNEKLAELYAILFELEDLDKEDYMFKGFIDGFSNIKKAAEKTKQSIKATGKVKEELEKEAETYNKKAFAGLVRGAGDFASILGKASGYMRQIAAITNDIQLEKSAEIMDNVVSALNAVVGGAQSGGIWGAIAGGVLSVITSIIEGVKKREAQVEKDYADYKKFQIDSEEQINMLIIERLKIQAEADTAFLNEISKRIEGYQKAATAAKDGLNALYSKTEYEWEGEIYKGLEAIKGLMVKSITEVTLSGRPVYKNLASYDIWNADKTGFDTEKLALFILKLGEADKDLREYLMSILELQKEYDDAVQAMADALTSSFDNLGSSAIDAITQSIENGTNAWGAFKESAADALKNVVANMLYTVYMSSKMQELKKNLESIAKGTYATEEDRANAIANYFGTWLEEAKPSFDTLMTATRGMYTKIDEIFGSAGGGGITTLSGAIKGASQESIDLLAGQTNAVRLNQVEALSLSRSQLFRLVSIDNGVQQIIQIMNANKGSNQIQTDILRAKGVTTL
jgi:hypothetical protein